MKARILFPLGFLCEGDRLPCVIPEGGGCKNGAKFVVLLLGDFPKRVSPISLENCIRTWPPDGIEMQEGESSEVFRNPAGHSNYRSVEDDPAAIPEIHRLVSTGYLKVFNTLESCEKTLWVQYSQTTLSPSPYPNSLGFCKDRLS